ncbi:glutathione S-transferase [Cladochytrium replicatum]|nr:glutathione S-transferase [Cladochytrium replicatum]
MPDIVLHHYPRSPNSEKVRLALRLKKIPFTTLPVSSIPPRPATSTLTRGYRRIPVLQIDENLYCDSALILEELERRFPDPSLTATHGDSSTAALARMIGFWISGSVSKSFIGVLPWEHMPEELRNDRAELFGNGMFKDLETLKSNRPYAREQLQLHVSLIENILSDGRAWILSKPNPLESAFPTHADIHAAMVVWWISNLPEKEWLTLDTFPHVTAWFARLYALAEEGGIPSEGVRTITDEEALKIALKFRENPVLAWPEGLSTEDPNDPLKKHPGMRVRISSDDAPSSSVEGLLVAVGLDRVAITGSDRETGLETFIHFPRLGYRITPFP